ncbi:MAG: FKBP-type peptidyl-prolyl cis-trans isomerase [Bacteroidota bacterium]
MQFKRLMFLVLSLSLFWMACDDTVTPEEQTAIDRGVIEEYVAENNLTGQYTETGIFYAFSEEGEGDDTPAAGSIIEIIYKGYLMDGTLFDSSDGFPTEFNLSGLIRGWQEGLQLFKRDAVGTLLIPSREAYGRTGRAPSIPANAVLRFEIELIDFQN